MATIKQTQSVPSSSPLFPDLPLYKAGHVRSVTRWVSPPLFEILERTSLSGKARTDTSCTPDECDT